MSREKKRSRELFNLYNVNDIIQCKGITQAQFDQLCASPVFTVALLRMVEDTVEYCQQQVDDEDRDNLFRLRHKFLYEITLLTGVQVSQIRKKAEDWSEIETDILLRGIAKVIDKVEVARFVLCHKIDDRLNLFCGFMVPLVQHYRGL